MYIPREQDHIPEVDSITYGNLIYSKGHISNQEGKIFNGVKKIAVS